VTVVDRPADRTVVYGVAGTDVRRVVISVAGRRHVVGVEALGSYLLVLTGDIDPSRVRVEPAD